jgi:hypothetical protein
MAGAADQSFGVVAVDEEAERGVISMKSRVVFSWEEVVNIAELSELRRKGQAFNWLVSDEKWTIDSWPVNVLWRVWEDNMLIATGRTPLEAVEAAMEAERVRLASETEGQ